MRTLLEITRLAKTLWILTALFSLRVLGQVAIEFLHARFLPPSEEWSSEVIPAAPPVRLAVVALRSRLPGGKTPNSEALKRGFIGKSAL